MDHIVDALERAKFKTGLKPENSRATAASPEPIERRAPAPPPAPVLREWELSAARLESMRVIAHDVDDARAKSFDMLRTQVLQTMAANDWRVIAVTSPTAGCGKTFIAINLALSIARQPETPVLLVDLDLQKPQIVQRLGIQPKEGIRAVLEGKATLSSASLQLRIEDHTLSLLPCERASSRSSDWLGSQATAKLLEQIKADPVNKIAIVDLPPVLTGDNVISVLPHVDCVLLVAAVGTTTKVELRECSKYLKSTPIVRIVLNKVPEPALSYY